MFRRGSLSIGVSLPSTFFFRLFSKTDAMSLFYVLLTKSSFLRRCGWAYRVMDLRTLFLWYSWAAAATTLISPELWILTFHCASVGLTLCCPRRPSYFSSPTRLGTQNLLDGCATGFFCFAGDSRDPLTVCLSHLDGDGGWNRTNGPHEVARCDDVRRLDQC